jgi:hypothetical protein
MARETWKQIAREQEQVAGEKQIEEQDAQRKRAKEKVRWVGKEAYT